MGRYAVFGLSSLGAGTAFAEASLQDFIGGLLLRKGRPGTSELAANPALTG